MKTFTDVYKTLRKKNRGQYALLASCLFFSVLLISAYLSVMRSPTVLAVLPVGGDSRKQVMMIFVLTMIGCAVFSLYAASLFFRQKSKDIGIFLALGMNRRALSGQLMRELVIIALLSCCAGILVSIPLTRGIWELFRLLIVDTEEMVLLLAPNALLTALLFSFCVTLMLLYMGMRSIRRINIIEIIQERHKSEPVHEVPRKYGIVGILLLIIGAILGYQAPSFFILILHWYPPEILTAIFYIPVFIGLYMILLHTVVNGWHRKKSAYKDIVATSQMKFQGRQTVQNLLVMSVLIAGAYFASFYTPIFCSGAMMSYDARPYDYVYHFRMDQPIPMEKEVRKLAETYDTTITDWYSAPMIRLGVDGTEHVETQTALGTTWEPVYLDMLTSELFLSESSYTAITGEVLNLTPGTLAAIMDSEGNTAYQFAGDAKLLTNTLTGQTLPITSVSTVANDALYGRYVMNDSDYLLMSKNLTPEWQETICMFNVENCEQTYDFAKALFHEIVNCSDSKVEVYDAWDPVQKQLSEEKGEIYWADPEYLTLYGFEQIDYDMSDSTTFRLYWKYMPMFRVLDKADFVKTTAVFMMVFVFVAIVCFAAVFVIAYTRSMTIAINGRQLYDDLRHLGASNTYLYRTVRSQMKRVFCTPAIIGTCIIYAFYIMIMFFNDNRLSGSELIGMAVCLLLIGAVSGMFYGVYRLTLKKVCAVLQIR